MKAPFIGLRRKISAFDRYYNLTSICCVYQEKIVKTTYSEERSVIQIQKVSISDSDRKYFFEAFVYS